MKNIRCPSCDAKLKLPASYSGGIVKCPRCGSMLSSNHDGARKTPMETPPVDGPPVDGPPVDGPPVDGPPVATTADQSAEETTRDSKGISTVSTTQTSEPFSAAETPVKARSKTPDFDFKFNRYWTPWIIRFSWIVILIFTVLWIGLLSIAFVVSFFGGSDVSLMDSFGLSDLSVSSLDLEGIMGGKADVDGLNQFLDNVTEGRSSAKQKKTVYQTFMTFGISTLSFLTVIASTILTLLFCRVFFETIIVLFDMSKTLKSIDEKTDSVP